MFRIHIIPDTASAASDVVVRVWSPLLPEEIDVTFTIAAGGSKDFKLPSTFAVSGTGKSSKTIRIESTNGDVALYALSETLSTGSCGAFVVLPEDTLSNKYITTGMKMNDIVTAVSRVVLVAVNQVTLVNVTVIHRREIAINARGSQLRYAQGSTFSFILGSHEAMQLEDDLDHDLSGLLIESEQQFAVFSSTHYMTTADVAGSVEEQLYPVASWGSDYVVVPDPMDVISRLVIVPSEKNTDIYVTNDTATTLLPGNTADEVIIVDFGSLSAVHSSEPISVAQVTQDTGGANSVMILLTSLQQFSAEYNFVAFGEAVRIAIVILSGEQQHLRLNDEPLSGYEWNTVPHFVPVFVASFVTGLEPASYTLKHDGGKRFGATVYDQFASCSTAYSAGLCLDDISQVHVCKQYLNSYYRINTVERIYISLLNNITSSYALNDMPLSICASTYI